MGVWGVVTGRSFTTKDASVGKCRKILREHGIEIHGGHYNMFEGYVQFWLKPGDVDRAYNILLKHGIRNYRV